jgi:hypothetical protein
LYNIAYCTELPDEAASSLSEIAELPESVPRNIMNEIEPAADTSMSLFVIGEFETLLTKKKGKLIVDPAERTSVLFTIGEFWTVFVYKIPICIDPELVPDKLLFATNELPE